MAGLECYSFRAQHPMAEKVIDWDRSWIMLLSWEPDHQPKPLDFLDVQRFAWLNYNQAEENCNMSMQ